MSRLEDIRVHLDSILGYAIYGLKQSPLAWFKKFSQLIFSQGLTACEVDPNVFWTSTSAGWIILVVYVDDILVIGSDITSIA